MLSGPPPDDRERYKALLGEALDLPGAERRAFVESRLAPGDERDEALALLDGVEGLDGFLERPFAAPRDAYRPALPERIGDFEIESVLGWGAMGVVYLARQSDPERRVALKVLRIDCGGPGAAARFHREAEVLARLDHPGIATVYQAGVADFGGGRQPWFAMEYVDGAPLGAHVESQRLGRRARIELVVRAARAVEHAHAAGIVHRDLKPENVLVRPDGTVKVVDFGVARTREEDVEQLTLTATGQVVGTLAYMAPEQARGGATGPAIDQYALGVLLYELLTGELPLAVRGLLPHHALRTIADGTWTPPSRHDPSLAGDLEAVLATALAPEPNRRYASVGAFADDLERHLSGRRVTARPPSRLDGALRFVRRNPLLVSVVAAALLVVGGAVAMAARSAIDRRRESEIALVMSDRALLAGLVDEADDLWPADSTRVPAIDRWLAQARPLAARRARYERWLARIVARRSLLGSQVVEELGGEWLVTECRRFVDDLQRCCAPGGLLDRMESRRADAAALAVHTVDEREADWAAAAARVAADERLGGLELVPQEGLVPLGPDPGSGLEEFAVYSTGAIPARGADGRVRAHVGDALTLVLVPGGESLVGAQPHDAESPNHFALEHWQEHFGPPVAVRLDPFLLSKFEVTQEQWMRLFGDNPSDWEVGSEIKGTVIGPLHPVDSVTWLECVSLLPRHELTLPTEAQWEVAARAGSSGARVFAEDLAGCAPHVNWASYMVSERVAHGLEDDGYYPHWPVGRGAPNAYGLHDPLGNVWELCLDVYKVRYHDLPHRAGDGLVLAEPDGDVSRRGGSCAMRPSVLHVFFRGDRLEGARDTTTGARPARVLRR